MTTYEHVGGGAALARYGFVVSSCVLFSNFQFLVMLVADLLLAYLVLVFANTRTVRSNEEKSAVEHELQVGMV